MIENIIVDLFLWDSRSDRDEMIAYIQSLWNRWILNMKHFKFNTLWALNVEVTRWRGNRKYVSSLLFFFSSFFSLRCNFSINHFMTLPNLIMIIDWDHRTVLLSKVLFVLMVHFNSIVQRIPPFPSLSPLIFSTLSLVLTSLILSSILSLLVSSESL